MPDDPYSLSDLARLADVTPRTVRYYVAQGLLPSPEAAGPATRYGEGHLARLRLIRRLQRDHLPLAEIRARLERMGDDEVVAASAALDPVEPDPSLERGDTLDFVRSLMHQAGVRPTIAERPVAPMAVRRAMILGSEVAPDEAHAVAEELAAPPAPAAAQSMPGPATAPTTAPAAPSAPAPSAPAPARSTWERLVISPDVELHVRRPLDRQSNKRVDQLERIARELFEDP